MNFRLIQWNSWYKEDPQKIAAVLQKLRPDIVCLQESLENPSAQISSTAKYVAETLGFSYSFTSENLTSPEGYTDCNVVLSRFPILQTQRVVLQEGKHGSYDTETRTVACAQVAIQNTTVWVLSTHLSYSHQFEMTPTRIGEVEKLQDVIRSLKGNIILAGDLNATPTSPVIASISSSLRDCGPTSEELTWTTKPFSYNGFEETKLHWRLDYVFASPQLAVTKAIIAPTEVSDHLPVVIDFKL